MKKLYIVMMLVLTGTMAIAQTSVWNGGRQMWTRGEGTESNPFLIESAENLAYLAYAVNKGYDMLGVHFLLTTDIDLNGSEDQQWVPIGLGSKYGYSEDGCDRGNPSTYGEFYPFSRFKGHFDGGEHSISNLYINQENGSNLGLFGIVYVENEENLTVIENVFVISGYIRGGGIRGGIVGRAFGANNGTVLISRCWNGATIEALEDTEGDCGGIVGQSKAKLKIQNCYNIGNVSGFSAGGILGDGNGEIEECYNKGDITGTYAGGIFGLSIQGRVTINNCYNFGDVVANTDFGSAFGIVGPAAGGIAGCHIRGTAAITNCYNVGAVSSTQEVGCILAYGPETTLENNYYINNCDAGGEGTPQTEEVMQSQAFVDLLNGQNEELVWALDVNHTNDGFPILTTVDLSVSEITEATFNVYPNPAQGRFTVEGIGRMTVSNLLGQVVLVKEIDGQTIVVLPKGMYFVKLGNETRKIVVE